MLEVKELANDERLQFARKLLAESNQQRLSQATLVKRKHHSSSSSIATNRPRDEPVMQFLCYNSIPWHSDTICYAFMQAPAILSFPLSFHIIFIVLHGIFRIVFIDPR